jgi:hypothetical protein
MTTRGFPIFAKMIAVEIPIPDVAPVMKIVCEFILKC